MSADIEELDLLEFEPKSREQLGILVLDGSLSMREKDARGEGTKAQAVGKAAKELIERLQESSRRQDFWLALIAFDNNVETRLLPTPATEINLSSLNTDPYLGGATAIGDALYVAGNIAEEFLDQEKKLPRSVVIMLMSDGEHNVKDSRKPRSVAEEIKSSMGKVNLVTVAYGKDADKELLQEIASDPETGFCQTDSGKELRNFFVASIVEVERPA